MLNENPPVTISQLNDTLKVFKVMGYGYKVNCSITSEVEFTVASVRIYNDKQTYICKPYEEFDGAWGFSESKKG